MAKINRRHLAPRREIALSDLSIIDRLILDFGPCRGWGEILTGLDVCREVWGELGDEVTAEFIARSPGCRPWAAWQFDLLPSDPRRRVAQDDPDLPGVSSDPPCCRPWKCDGGYESSYRYLSRRGLLGPGELDSIRRKHDVREILEAARETVERVAEKYRDNVRMAGCELATLAEIFGTDEFDPDELHRAAPFRLSPNGRH